MVPSGLSSIFRALFTGRIFSLHCNNNKKKIIDETKLQVHHFSCLFRIGKSQLFHTLELFIRLTLVNFFCGVIYFEKCTSTGLGQSKKFLKIKTRKMLCYKFGNSFFGGMHENVNHQTFPDPNSQFTNVGNTLLTLTASKVAFSMSSNA